MVATHGISVGIQHDWVKQLDSNLYEIRSRVSNNQQRGLYFHVEENHYVITHGFTYDRWHSSRDFSHGMNAT